MVRVIYRGILACALLNISFANNNELVNLLEKDNFICGVDSWDSGIQFCKQLTDSSYVEYKFKNDVVNIGVINQIAVDKNNYNEIYLSQRKYCEHAFSSLFKGADRATAMNLLDLRIDSDIEKIAFTEKIGLLSVSIMKGVRLNDDIQEVTLFCTVSPFNQTI